jgi:hypothetical protein
MNEITPNNINTYGVYPTPPIMPWNSGNKNISNSANPESSNFVSGSSSEKDLLPMIKLLSSQMGVSEMVASRLLRKLLASGQAGTLSEMKNFLIQYLQGNTNQELDSKRKILFDELRARTANATNERQLETAFKPLVQEMNDKFVQTRQQNMRNAQALFFTRDGAQGLQSNLPIPVTPLVTSPKEFASWLVNNKAAFISMRANPMVTNLLIALQNPQIQQSPVMIAEIAKLLAQLVKLKQGSKVGEYNDSERVDEDRDKEDNLEVSDHEHHVVGHIRETIENVAITPLRDFLIEAERFAEEEVANLWSLTLKKEKELEKKVKASLKKFKKPQ